MLRDLWRSCVLGGVTCFNLSVSMLVAAGLMTAVFASWKLAGTVDWSWWAVTSPVWSVGALLLALEAMFVLAIYALSK
jgi:hypothetical protein